ncbi:reticulon-1-A-like isoform X3 [Synchiropus splendidus]|uniref:reticulon-1-A-like isoform X3 n=1 Tax=Synchiropus splendidus TaxID=270530 RepID=UPI00237DBAE0|nr:reticulon-1-A-like isoform X3 [Synchiropus splendidus]
MADDEQQVSSTVLLNEQVHHYQPEPESEQAGPDIFSADDIVDLVGGARDALERHLAEEDKPPGEFSEEPVTSLDPEPEQPQPAAPIVSESSRLEAEPEAARARAALPAAEARTEAPASPPAEARPAETAEPAAPVLVVDLLYWRDVRTSGWVFGALLLVLLSLTACSIISVVSYVGLALLSVTICFRVYKGVLQAVHKSDEGHPFRQYIDQEVALSEELVHRYSDALLTHLNHGILELRRLFLVQDLVDSLKAALILWILTYVGSWFNGLTLGILGVMAAFSFPVVYEKHQAQIDHYVALVNNHVQDVVAKIQAAVPGLKRKAE